MIILIIFNGYISAKSCDDKFDGHLHRKYCMFRLKLINI